jgi:F-type H+-transporting ATPase subunit delta
MKTDAVTARYVEALFGLGTRTAQLDTIKRGVERLAASLERPGVLPLVLHPAKPRAIRRAAVEEGLSGASGILRNFVDLLFEKRRESVLAGLGEAFRQRLLEASGVVEGVVTSARPLGSGELAELTVSLGARLGKEVRLKNEIDPSLIAGVRVIVDSRMVDCSVAGRLIGIKRRMMDAPLPR